MKTLLLATFALFSTAPSFAAVSDEIRIMPVETEMHARKQTCLSAESTVRRRGAVIVHYGDGLFERIVAHSGFCQRYEGVSPFYVPTMDSEACYVGFRCVPNDHGAEE